jgi:hypothetical protein
MCLRNYVVFLMRRKLQVKLILSIILDLNPIRGRDATWVFPYSEGKNHIRKRFNLFIAYLRIVQFFMLKLERQ